MDTNDMALPPASFELLVISLRMQAEQHLGLIRYDGSSDKPEANFPLARHTIDLLAMLEEKTRGNLSLEERRLLENSVTELRFRFVQANEQQNSSGQSA